LLMRQTGSDTELARVWSAVKAGRLAGMASLAHNLHDGGHLRPGTSVDDARDVLWTYSSPELFELLVVERGWSPERYARFIASATTAALLAD